jgi:uncharacterized protein (UPF0332 family)
MDWNTLFKEVPLRKYTLAEKIGAFFYHLKMMLFTKGIDRERYVATFEAFKKYKDTK